jgi:hypothetical protein
MKNTQNSVILADAPRAGLAHQAAAASPLAPKHARSEANRASSRGRKAAESLEGSTWRYWHPYEGVEPRRNGTRRRFSSRAPAIWAADERAATSSSLFKGSGTLVGR